MAAPGRTHVITCTAPALNGGDANGLFFLNLADPLLADVFTYCLASGLDIAVTAVGSSVEYVKALSNWNYAGNSGCLLFVVPTTAASTVIELSFGGTTTTADQAITNVMGGTVNGFWPLDEASGNGLDFGPNGYDLAHTNLAAQGVAGEIEDACDYDSAVPSYSSNATAFNIDWATALTVAFWVNFETHTAYPRIINRYDGASKGMYIDRYAAAGVNGPMAFYAGVDAANRLYVRGGTNLATGAWHHVAISYDGSKNAGGITIVVNGANEALTTIVDAGNVGNSTVANNFFLSQTAGANVLNGLLDNVLILSGAALTVAQMQDIHTLQNAYNGPNTGWTFGPTLSALSTGQSKLHSGIRIGI